MIHNTKILGLLLILLGVIGYVVSGMASFTALIPAIYGAVFLLLGKFGEDESRRKVAMQMAQLLALLAVAGTFTGILDVISWLGGNQEVNMMAATIRALMAVMSIGYLILGIKSFIDERRGSKDGAGLQEE